MKALKIAENVYWVGAIDHKLRNFHGYSTEKGSTYNAYLIIDEEITLIDLVKSAFASELIERINSVIDISKIKNIVCNHVEPDHSGAINEILKYAPNAAVYASAPSGIAGLKKYYGDLPLKSVKSGDVLNIGKSNLNFVQTPMVHWPDNMVCVHDQSKILFSNDAFGQHYATYSRMDSEVDTAEALKQAKKYFANIVLPYVAQVKKATDDLANINFDIIAPSHGILWKDHIADIMKLYSRFITSDFDNKAIIVYDTMWDSTKQMAYAIADGFADKDIDFEIMDLQSNHISDILTEISLAKYVAVGSPTLNNNMLPTVAAFLCYQKGLSPKGKKYVAFGSYGWGGQSIAQIDESLKQAAFTPLTSPLKVQYKPTNSDLKNITETIKNSI